MKVKKGLFVIFILTGYSLVCAQLRDETGIQNPYYIDMNRSAGSKVFEIQNGLLSLQYQDKHGKTADIPLTIYNWKRELIARYNLIKTFGLNYFNINLGDDLSLELGKLYSCRIADEAGKVYEIYFRPVTGVETESLIVSIQANPLNLKCDDPGSNSVEFYGNIKLGKAPYKVSWFVVDDSRSNLVYQPRTETISRPGYTTMITVDHNPDYYVLLLVRDACGAEGRQMVHLICSEKKRNVNTIFVEPIQSIPMKLREEQ